MIIALIRFALKHRLFTIAMSLVVAGLGIWSALNIAVDSFPDVSNVQVQIITEPASMATDEVESLITFPIENGLNGLPKVTRVRSNSSFGLSVVTAIFEDDVDAYWARNIVQQRLNQIELPEDAPKPMLGPLVSTFQMFSITISPAIATISPSCAPFKIGRWPDDCARFRVWATW